MTYAPDPRPRVLVKANVGKAVGVSAAALALATSLAAANEGESLTAFVDRLGKGNPITYCYGETSGEVRSGDKFTHEQCIRALRVSAMKHAEAVQRCLPQLPDKTAAALYDLGYNLGPGPICTTRAYRPEKPHSQQGLGWYFATGDYRSGCYAIQRYVFSAKKDCRIKANRCGGILRRRADETALCLEGLK